MEKRNVHGSVEAIKVEELTPNNESDIKASSNLEKITSLQSSNSDYSDIINLCRICLLAKNNVISLIPDIHKDVIDMYFQISLIEVKVADEYPLQLCEACKCDLIFCYQFKMKCQKSDAIFKTITNGQNTKEKVQSQNSKISVLSEYALKEENIDITNLKGEYSEHEDIQYLEDINELDDESENIALSFIQSEKQQTKDKLKITLTDSLSLLKKLSSNKHHNNQNERKKSHECPICLKKFPKSKSLKIHIASDHGAVKHLKKCNHCKESFNSEHDLHLHSALHAKSSVWTCNKCQKEFKAKGMLRRHIQRHMETKPHSCPSCGKAFAELYALRRHVRVHTGEVLEKKFACTQCDKKYSTSSMLAAHASAHSGERPCVCAACGKAFSTQRLLASHRLVHSEHKPFACQYCDKSFRHESTRNTHHRTHTGEKPYICSSCGKKFIQGSNLVLHMRTHTGEKPYSCKVCERRFSSGSSLKNHQRTHTGDKPYACHVCGKRFARMDMRIHMMQHTGERSHACTVCHKKFSNAWRLRTHCRIHTGEKPYECATCSDKFATKSHLMKHVKGHQKTKKSEKREVLIVRQLDLTEQPYIVASKIVFPDDKHATSTEHEVTTTKCDSDKDINMDLTQDMPLEVILQDDSDMKSDFLVQSDGHYQNGNICLNEGVHFVDGMNDTNVNYVTVSESDVSSSSMIEGTTVKLYHLDQRVVQIVRSGRQLTISKVTSE